MTAKQIQKYILYPGLPGQLPQGKILLMENSPHPLGSELVVWVEALVNDDLHPVEPLRTVTVYPTGGTPPETDVHLCSAGTHGGLIWHLYDTTATR